MTMLPLILLFDLPLIVVATTRFLKKKKKKKKSLPHLPPLTALFLFIFYFYTPLVFTFTFSIHFSLLIITFSWKKGGVTYYAI